MKVISSFWNMLRRADNSAAEAMKDPVGDAELAIEDSKKKIAEFTLTIAKAIAENKRFEKEQKEAHLQAEKYQRIAEAALKAGNEDDARSALSKAQTNSSRSDALKKDIARNDSLIQKQRDILNKLKTKVDNAASNKRILEMRHNGAKSMKALASAQADFAGDGSPFAALDNLEDSVVQAETEAEAYTEMFGADDLEDKYANLEGEASVDDALAAMKAKLGSK